MLLGTAPEIKGDGSLIWAGRVNVYAFFWGGIYVRPTLFL